MRKVLRAESKGWNNLQMQADSVRRLDIQAWGLPKQADWVDMFVGLLPSFEWLKPRSLWPH